MADNGVFLKKVVPVPHLFYEFRILNAYIYIQMTLRVK